MPAKKNTEAETTAPQPEEAPAESPVVSEAPQDEGFLVCVAKTGGLQIHLVKDEEDEENARDKDNPRVDEVRSRVLKLGDYVAVCEAEPQTVAMVKADEIEGLKYAEDEKEVRIFTLEAKNAEEEFVYVERVFYSADRKPGQSPFGGMLVGGHQ